MRAGVISALCFYRVTVEGLAMTHGLKSFPRILAAGVLLVASLSGSVGAAEPLKIAVIGGNGMIGQRIVREALDRGHHVTVIVRDPDRVEAKHERLQLRQGDVLESKQISGLITGQNVIVCAVGSARAKAPDPSLYLRAAESLVSTLRSIAEKAPRLIVVGGVGSLKNASGQLLLERIPPERKSEHLGQKAALDYYRTVHDVSWTYVSPPGTIKPGERTGVFRLGDDTLLVNDKGESSITMEDYAIAIIDEAENPRHIGRRFTVGY
jgi:putative NADH-flavin reductase